MVCTAPTPCYQPAHAVHHQSGRQVRREHRQEDQETYRQPAHRPGQVVCDQDLERQPLPAHEHGGLHARRACRGDAGRRLDVQPPMKAVKMVTEGIENYTFGDMARGVQQCVWNEVCDWYVEVTKARLEGRGRLQASATPDLCARHLHSPDAPAHAVCHRGDTGTICRRACSTWMPRATWTAPRRSHDRQVARSPPTTSSTSTRPAERAFELCRTVVPPPVPRVRVIA